MLHLNKTIAPAIAQRVLCGDADGQETKILSNLMYVWLVSDFSITVKIDINTFVLHR